MLTYQQREIATISALSALGNVVPQLNSHKSVGKYNCLTDGQIGELSQIAQGGQKSIFPLGEPVNPKQFIGGAWHKMLSADNPFNARIGNVTFAPGARNHWHSHKVGQILLVTGGEGWYQEWGKAAQKFKEGDVVNIPADVKHWHGATKYSWFAHIAITAGESEWFEPVKYPPSSEN